MVQQFKLLWLLSAVVLFCSGFTSTEASVIGDVFYNPNRTVVLDRSVDTYAKPGYYLLPVDRTTFTVDRYLWLHQFNLSKVYIYHAEKEEPIDVIPVKYQIVRIQNRSEEVLLAGKTKISSNYVASVKFHDILLKPDYYYEIRVELPEKVVLMYIDNLEIKEYYLRRFYKPIQVKFYQHNAADKPPPGVEGGKRLLSHGLVKQLYLKYRFFN